ncbi:putative O-methyltransferase YrrM [Filimonas zeae]|uniref:O-methyltransferase n=1 Tax=Filimonas zeae TaxID=1737353 RepID=A0A917J3X7_9BACT|nr:class I SAM-dependent methyltransferase [Filimonas zeae]MDR6342875.1 putative O-methyltransferase YrrM [Filimonas zeae]GGH83048.1 O-methyltransferase [Filimonas zeae]
MYSKFQLSLRYIQYWLRSSNSKGHGVHSPFVFSFITDVLNDKGSYYCYQPIESLRAALQQDNTELEIADFGAGSRVNSSKRRKVSSIASSALKPAKYSQLMFRMVNYYQPAIVLELGTSLGITSSYLASGNPAAKVITMEGAPAIATVARNNFASLRLANISLVEGNFDETLPGTLAKLPAPVDFAFVDGNHRYQPTMDYFNQLLAVSHDHTIIILDDIHWSSEMEQVWEEVKQHPAVTMTIDLFFIGIVLMRKEFKIKQHFSVRF